VLLPAAPIRQLPQGSASVSFQDFSFRSGFSPRCSSTTEGIIPSRSLILLTSNHLALRLHPLWRDSLHILWEISTPLANEKSSILPRATLIKSSREGVIVSLRETGFYESGSANLRASSQPAIDRLALILRTHGEALRIEGHTDNIPIHNARFDSNWELSTARAAELIKLFITKYKFVPERLSAAGYAEYRPVAPNNSAEGRGMNRRVDIVILNPTPSADGLASAETPKPILVAPIQQNKAPTTP
jgi:outer membrane protein OmpA-like peptidoglycan-associated protein